MKASALSSKRIAIAAVAGLTALSTLTGCGFETRQQAAAIVNGQVIHEDDVAETVRQLNAAQFQSDDKNVIAGLIAANLLGEAAHPGADYKPDATYATILKVIPGASETTKQFASAVAMIQPDALTTEQIAQYRALLNKATITLNPKYGVLKQSEQAAPVYFSLGADQPNWIKPFVDQNAP